MSTTTGQPGCGRPPRTIPRWRGAMIGTPRYLSHRVALAMPRAISSTSTRAAADPTVSNTRTPSATSGITTASIASQSSSGTTDRVELAALNGTTTPIMVSTAAPPRSAGTRMPRGAAGPTDVGLSTRHPDAGHDEEHGARDDSGESDSDSTALVVAAQR